MVRRPLRAQPAPHQRHDFLAAGQRNDRELQEGVPKLGEVPQSRVLQEELEEHPHVVREAAVDGTELRVLRVCLPLRCDIHML